MSPLGPQLTERESLLVRAYVHYGTQKRTAKALGYHTGHFSHLMSEIYQKFDVGDFMALLKNLQWLRQDDFTEEDRATYLSLYHGQHQSDSSSARRWSNS